MDRKKVTKKAPNRCALVIMDNHILTQKKNLLAVLFRMVPKQYYFKHCIKYRYRAVLFRMVLRLIFCMIISEFFLKMKGLSMENDVFFDYFLRSLRFHFRDRCKDIGFIEFFKDENNCFITIEDYVLESFVILSNILSQERIVFSCGIIYSKGVVTGVEVCMNVSELERLNKLYKI